MRKERFPKQQKSKLDPRGNRTFQVLECVNNNAYKIDMLGKDEVFATFSVSNLFTFDIGEDSRMNPFKEGEMMEARS